MREQLTARWDAFLNKMDQRFEEALLQGETAVLENLEENDYDYYSSYRTLRAIQSQIYETVIRKIDDTWREQVEPLMRADGIYWADESRKGYRLTDNMHERMERWLLIAEGKLSQRYYDHAIQLINREFLCTQCNSPLEVKQHFFLAQYVTCRYCQAVNTFEPETKYVQIGWNVVNNIARLHALEEHTAMLAAKSQGTEAYLAACRRYYERYFDERIKLMPDTAATREHDITMEINKLLKY